MKRFYILLLLLLLSNFHAAYALADSPKKLEKPPVSERWFGVYVDNERMGFYRQRISESADGYRIEGDSSVHMKVMGFSKEAGIHEVYQVAGNLTLRSFEVEQTINGESSRVTGKVSPSGLRYTSVSNGKRSEKLLRFKGDLFPGPALNIFPLMRDATAGKVHKVVTFDPEELKIKEVKVTVIGEEKTADGQTAIKLRNNLYPFVNNDILVDLKGNTLLESVRDGLVMTRFEEPGQLGAYVGSMVLSKKDLIYDFSMVRVEPPLRDPAKLTGMAVEISGWSDALPLLQEGGQSAAGGGEGRITVRTGSLAARPEKPAAPTVNDRYLKPADRIESDAVEIVAKAKELTGGRGDHRENVRILSSWTSEWLKDTIDDSGSALTSLKGRYGNCQTHARLYTALARAAGIPTRFVSGLVYREGLGFLYHSWAESLLAGEWVAVDPTYNQLPADPTHIKFFEGHLPENMMPIISLVGRIRINVLETKY